MRNRTATTGNCTLPTAAVQWGGGFLKQWNRCLARRKDWIVAGVVLPNSSPLWTHGKKRNNENHAPGIAGTETFRTVEEQMLKVVVIVTEAVMYLIIAVENWASILLYIVARIIFTDTEIVDYFHARVLCHCRFVRLADSIHAHWNAVVSRVANRFDWFGQDV